jgi:Beta-propeller repeat
MPAARARVQASYASLPLAFEQNQGQTDAQVKYMARGNGYTLFLTATDAVFSLRTPSAESKSSDVRRSTQLRTKGLPAQRNPQKDSTAAVRMQLVGANSQSRISASGQLPGKSNYFIGNDPSKWQTDVAHYARVSYQDVYPGVNLAFHGAQRQTEFDFVVAPGADPAPIGFHFTGAQGMKTDDSGNLVIASTAGNVLLHKPFAYQEQNGARQPVDARFILKANNQVSFELGNYDHTRDLVIDPSVSYLYSTYLGGSGNDEGYAIAFDGSNNAYVTGQTASANFPGASNTLTGTVNAFVTSIAGNGSALIYSVYIGGNGPSGDSGNAIAVNLSGDAFVAGGTTSSNFPHTAGVFQTTLKGAGNAFVLELSPSGTLTYSTYLGGTGKDAALGIALASDSSGDVIVAGRTSSTDFPTLGPIQTSGGGFVTKLNSSGTALAYSTYLAVAGDSVNAVAVDSSDNAYVTGQTFSASFHTTTGAFQTTCGSCTSGNSNAFVTVINPSGSGYVYSTFLGGNNIDAGDGVAVDSTSNAYVTGVTTSSNFPKTSGAFQTTYGGATDAFVTKLNSAGSALVYSTFLGGNAFDTGAGIALDANNNAYVTGQTSSANFPTSSATQASINGGNNTTGSDAFVSELNATGSQLIFSTYLGGSGNEDDGGFGGIATNGGFIYVTGDTQSTDFPTQSPFQAANGGGGNSDAFVVKYSQSTTSSFTLSATALSPSTVSPGGSATSTVSVIPNNGFSGTVTLTCVVSSPAGAVHPPTCGAASATPAAPGTLTVNTTAGTALLRQPLKDRLSGLFYAMFLPVGGTVLLGLGFSRTGSCRKKLFGFLLLGLLLSSLFLMPACGGGSGGGGGGGGSSGTTAGTYTITVSGGASETGTQPSLTLTVN